MIFIFDIYLSLLFSVIELLGGEDEGGDVLPVVLLRHLHASLGLDPLLLGVVEDGGHVLARAGRGRVVVVPEDVQQVASAVGMEDIFIWQIKNLFYIFNESFCKRQSSIFVSTY